MVNKIWAEEEEKFKRAIERVKIPNRKLCNVDVAVVKIKADLDSIPEKSGGCYWIWTNEPVNHSLHKNPTPKKFSGGEIIYNGIAKDNVRGRIEKHLFGSVDEGWSAISLDLHMGKTISHRKKAFSRKGVGKVPFINKEFIAKKANTKKGISKGDILLQKIKVRNKENLLHLHLSNEEREFACSSKKGVIYFRNGINLEDEKHKNFEFKVYYIAELSTLYLEFIEKEWRKKFGLPKLCSYISGR